MEPDGLQEEDKCKNPKGFTQKQRCKNLKTRSKKGERKNDGGIAKEGKDPKKGTGKKLHTRISIVVSDTVSAYAAKLLR